MTVAAIAVGAGSEVGMRRGRQDPETARIGSPWAEQVHGAGSCSLESAWDQTLAQAVEQDLR